MNNNCCICGKIVPEGREKYTAQTFLNCSNQCEELGAKTLLVFKTMMNNPETEENLIRLVKTYAGDKYTLFNEQLYKFGVNSKKFTGFQFPKENWNQIKNRREIIQIVQDYIDTNDNPETRMSVTRFVAIYYLDDDTQKQIALRNEKPMEEEEAANSKLRNPVDLSNLDKEVDKHKLFDGLQKSIENDTLDEKLKGTVPGPVTTTFKTPTSLSPSSTIVSMVPSVHTITPDKVNIEQINVTIKNGSKCPHGTGCVYMPDCGNFHDVRTYLDGKELDDFLDKHKRGLPKKTKIGGGKPAVSTLSTISDSIKHVASSPLSGMTPPIFDSTTMTTTSPTKSGTEKDEFSPQNLSTN